MKRTPLNRPPEPPEALSGDDAAEKAGPGDVMRKAKAAAWRRETAQALASSNDWVDRHGLPLGRYRPF